MATAAGQGDEEGRIGILVGVNKQAASTFSLFSVANNDKYIDK
jgi:hypothetical protein